MSDDLFPLDTAVMSQLAVTVNKYDVDSMFVPPEKGDKTCVVEIDVSFYPSPTQFGAIKFGSRKGDVQKLESYLPNKRGTLEVGFVVRIFGNDGFVLQGQGYLAQIYAIKPHPDGHSYNIILSNQDVINSLDEMRLIMVYKNHYPRENFNGRVNGFYKNTGNIGYVKDFYVKVGSIMLSIARIVDYYFRVDKDEPQQLKDKVFLPSSTLDDTVRQTMRRANHFFGSDEDKYFFFVDLANEEEEEDSIVWRKYDTEHAKYLLGLDDDDFESPPFAPFWEWLCEFKQR